MKNRLDPSNKVDYNIHNLSGVNLQAARFQANGGYSQQERMIYDKKRSLERALWHSYQAAEVSELETNKILKALINPNVVKQDYDDKIISIGFESGFGPGTVFQWENTGTVWLVYLQDLTELAYFRGDIRKCSYSVKWKDENNNTQNSYIALRGPLESKISSINKHDISIDVPNYTLNFLVPRTEATDNFFKRYTKFYLNGVCWQVEGIDSISMPGIIEVNAVEYYINTTEDDVVNGVVGEFVTEKIDPNAEDNKIKGKTFIDPKTEEIYENIDESEYAWSVDKKYPVSIQQINNKQIKLIWEANYSGQFELYCGPHKRTIVVQSLF